MWCDAARAQLVNQTDGVALIEAENFDANLGPRSSHQWSAGSSTAGFNGTGYMEALPNDGTNIGTATNANPELQFSVNFTSTGTHYLWFRAYAAASTDDSIYIGIDGANATAVTLNQYNVWQWSNTLQAGGAATINIANTGTKTVNVWMREDGIKLDRILLTTQQNPPLTIGNAWHIPINQEPAGTTMRAPFAVYPGNNVTIYNGNQYQGTGNVGDQATSTSRVFYKKSTDSVWSSVAMSFHSQSGNNKYHSGVIPSSAFVAGDTVQYYVKVGYTDHLPTYLYGNDGGSNTTDLESVAQATPFNFIVRFPLLPDGGAPYHSFDSGNFQGRIYDDSGHIALAEPDLNGNALANVITFAPASIKIGVTTYDIGKILGVTPITNGLELTQNCRGTAVTSRLTFLTTGVLRYEVINWNGLVPIETYITAASDNAEHFYGFGEKFNSLDQAGKKVRIMASDIGGDKNDFSYKSSSWFLSNRGYGLHLDSSAESFFDMRNGAADRFVVQNLLGTLKFNIVGGPKLTDALSRYTGVTGRPYLPPPWVFGTWVSSDIWHNGGEVRYTITKHLTSGIPISVFVFDSPWEVAYNDFTWNMTQWSTGGTYEGQPYSGFATVNDMMTFLQKNGVKVICWMTPFINTSSNNEGIPGQNTGQSGNYAFAAANNYFVRSSPGGPPLSVGWWKGTGSPVDFTNPAAKSWLLGQLQTLVNQSNITTANASSEPAIGGFKTDDGENVNGGPDYIPKTAVYFDGRTGVEMQNGYCVEYHKAVSSVLGSNGILFARSGFNGTGAYPAGWPGDNQPNYSQSNGLQSVITSGVSAAMSGYSIWGHDIGGYQNANFEANKADLFMRWSQYGAFTPLMQMHRNVNTGNLEQFPWGYGATALANYVTYAKLHSQLFPYIYTYAKEASVNGLPIIRPLVLLNQADPLLSQIQHTYYFGNELLVAPMNAAVSTARNVQLPAGYWYDFWTNAKYTGGQQIVWSNADTTKMPLFVREGAIVPLLQNVPQTLCDANYVNNNAISTMDSALQLLIYPGPPAAHFTIYDGTTADCTVAATTTNVVISSTSRAFTLKIFANAAPAGVERDGLRLTHHATQNDYNAASLGWFYDASAKFLHVKWQHAGGSTTIGFGPDSVGDGVTDSWRSFYGITDDSADGDGDGLTNGQEYFSGTNPNDPQSTFKTSSVNLEPGGDFHVFWPSQLGISYRVQWKNSLTDAMWQSITPDFAGNGLTLDWLDDGTQTGGSSLRRFYRVAVP